MLLDLWNRLQSVPYGNKIFSFALGLKVPYTSTIHPEVLHLEAGQARVRIRDKRRVRNHLNSIHAIALMNLGELVSGLAVMSSLPKSARAIPTRLEIDFIKKARGTLTAFSEFKESIENVSEKKTCEVIAEIKNESGEVVSRVKAHWLIRPGKA